jgi:hypothetical protein
MLLREGDPAATGFGQTTGSNNVEPGEIQELEALIWKKLPNQ